MTPPRRMISFVTFLLISWICSSVQESEADWCKDDIECQRYEKDMCITDDWVQLNCPKKCGICGNSGNAGVTQTSRPTVNPFAVPPNAPTSAPDVAIVVPYEKYNFTHSPTAAPLVPNVAPQETQTAPVVSAGPATPLGALESNGYKGEIANITTYPQNTSQQLGGYDINANTNPLTEAGSVETPSTGYSEDTYEPDQHAVLESTQAPLVGIGPGTVNATTEEPLVSSQVTRAHAHNTEGKTWVVEIPTDAQKSQGETESIKISLIKDPVEAERQGMREVDLRSKHEEETIKISFRGPHHEHQHAHNEQHEVLETNDHKHHGKEEIKISFVKKKNATTFPTTEDNESMKDIKISFVTKGNRTIAQEVPISNQPVGINQNEVVENTFADQTPKNKNQGRNISVSFVGSKVLKELPPAQQPTFMPEDAVAGVGNVTELWCNDSVDCHQFGNDQCHDDWLRVNCPKKCGICGTGSLRASPHKELSVEIPKEVTSTLSSTKGPIVIKIQNEGGVEEISKEQGKGPIIENIQLNLPSGVASYQEAQAAQPEQKPESTGPIFEQTQQNAKVIPETASCFDHNDCSKYEPSQCYGPWMQKNCPVLCEICRPICNDSAECNRYTEEFCDNDWMKTNCKKKCGLCLGPCRLDDHHDCTKYPDTECTKNWFGENCKRKCGLCQAEKTNESEPGYLSKGVDISLPNSDLRIHLDCFYDGIKHSHGEKWSPGPCTPNCACHNGKVKCTVIECPALTCEKPIKKRWKCCPECPREEGLNARCIQTSGGNGNGDCCVFPFTYGGTQYLNCTDLDHDQKWCAVTSDYDVDGQWGNCIGEATKATMLKMMEQQSKTKPAAIEPDQTVHVSFIPSQDNELLASHYLSSKPSQLTATTQGMYGEWHKWTKCTASCGGGTQERKRACIPKSKGDEGKYLDCSSLGPALETRECNAFLCPENGGYTAWSEWEKCSASCGGGVQQRTRTCDSPPAARGGQDCIKRGLGSPVETRTCNDHLCPMDGGYTDWTGWSECDKTCGVGKKVRYRNCTNPKPTNGGRDCSWLGKDKEVTYCNNAQCEVDGGYSRWSEWTPCSRTCGPGVTSRHRSCDSPTPSAYGKDCSNLGPAFEQKACFTQECLSRGNWTKWTEWSDCTKTCGSGIQFRTRKCYYSNPAEYCLGEKQQSKLCATRHCPVDGMYTTWSEFTPCSTTCGVGTKTRKRTCTNPTPMFGGKSCEDQGMGLSTEANHCYVRQCAVDGKFSDWTDWTACSRTCGAGLKTRTRNCTNPPPANGGWDCARLGQTLQSIDCLASECPVHGNYSAWSNWTACSATCGEGTSSRYRDCTNPTPKHGGNDCSAIGPRIESQKCIVKECVVDGSYSDWTTWSKCSKTCGKGIKKRVRFCTRPLPQNGGKNCSERDLGPSEDFKHCFERSCPLDGGYDDWSAWSTCSVSCGGGVKNRFRKCINPPPMHGGKDCSGIGPATETGQCHDEPCPINGNYGAWSLWSECDKSCGQGKRVRSRSCSNPSPQFGGSDCSIIGPKSEVQACYLPVCPVHGNYSEWSLWSPCSVTCGVGVVKRTRFCTNPQPSYGGKDCSALGPAEEKKSCELIECRANCTCGRWTRWSDCTKSCGAGIQTRERDCSPPKFSKMSCREEMKESQLCNTDLCPIDGKFGDWSPWSACSVTCGVGTKNRTRSCTAPSPYYGGKSCSEQELGPEKETSVCYLAPCPVNGGYTEWADWESCSTSCGKGIKVRRRMCTNPEPAYGGLLCDHLGAGQEQVECYVANCPIDGRFTPWTPWSACSVSCNWGIQTRKRSCTKPEPQHGGRDCTEQGDPEQLKPCQVIPCPMHGNYTAWSAWGACSASCGKGMKKRTRTCTNPTPENGGLTCEERKLGPNTEITSCAIKACPVNGEWGPWSDYSVCSAACGPGVKERKRSCENPAPQNGGRDCEGVSKQVIACSYRPCPVDGNFSIWSPWSKCSKPCGYGISSRWRACSSPAPQFGGRDCMFLGPDTDTKFCNPEPCQADGNWGEWSGWSGCSAPCGSGTRKRVRVCNRPAPTEGGRNCTGDDTQYLYCMDRPCCDVEYQPVGCFKDNGDPRPLPEMLFTDNDPTSSEYSGITVKGDNWDSYLPDVICRCAKAATIRGYSHFGLQGYGECYSGPRAGMTYSKDGIQGAFIQQPAPKPWVGCITKDFQECRDENEDCVGQEKTNFVYGFYNITPLDGGFADWSPWTPCSQTCGQGVRSRTRNCTNPAPKWGGKDCSILGEPQESEQCDNPIPCPVDGGFSNWGNWSRCNVMCGKGMQVRSRVCNSPSPANGGRTCIGSYTQGLPCELAACAVNGSWSAWSAWQACSATCGDGVQIRTRMCDRPEPSNSGEGCSGDAIEQKPCAVRRCPISGNYTAWTDWSACSRSCGSGKKFRTRDCTNPLPMYGGRNCTEIGTAREVVHCNPEHCPVHGNWAAWSMWSFCSSSCGAGKRERMRRCDNPAPKYGGRSCIGSDRQDMPCSLSDCPVDGRWSAWSNWTKCSAECGAAKRSRIRDCNSPPPAHGGKSCEGSSKQEEYCSLAPCKVDGEYSSWGPWTQCDVTCGGGHRQRSRACTNPVPEFGGSNCAHLGPDVQNDGCNTQPCAQAGGWSGWSMWTACSRSCGSGVQVRVRSCTAPPPSYGGPDCNGDAKEYKSCKLQDCCEVPYMAIGCYRDEHRLYRPLPKLLFSDKDKNLENWPEYLSDTICRCARQTKQNGFSHFGIQNMGDCYSGDRGDQTFFQEGEQLRFASNPQPKPWVGCVNNEMKHCSNGNLECSGQERTNYVYTTADTVPLDGNYTAWGQWSPCTETCGKGQRYRMRNCSNPAPSLYGKTCSFVGEDSQEQDCKMKDCEIHGNWGQWGNWSTCTAKCGNGQVHRRRVCNDPEPAFGGKPCAGEGQETADCRLTPCPVDGRWSPWSAWSACSVTCGNGRQSRLRKCNAPSPAYGGKFCDGTENEYQNCEEDDCPGYWSDWSGWSTCTKSCGTGGTRYRSRTCQGAAICDGSAREIELCERQQCPVCHNPLDLAFLLDSSGTVDDAQWKLTKDLVKGVSNAFHLASNGTRVGIITYSTLPTLELKFDEKNSEASLDDFLDTVTQHKGDTRTDRALKAARDELFVPETGARQTVPKAVVVVTDGGSTRMTVKAAERRARELKDQAGATVVAIGIGNEVDQYELRQIASDPEHAFIGSLYDDIIDFVKPVTDVACTAKPPPPPPRWGSWSDWSPCMKTCGTGLSVRSRNCLTGNNCRGAYSVTRKCKVQDCPECNLALDLGFALPVSSDIKDMEWKKIQDFVKSTTNAFNVSYEGTHVGLVSYSSLATLELKLNRYYYPNDIKNAVENIYPEAKSEVDRRLDDALEIAEFELFTAAGGARKKFPKSLVVLASGKLGPQKLDDITSRLRATDVTVVAVGVGPDVDEKQLHQIANKNSFYAKSFDDLIGTAGKVVRAVCQVPPSLARKLAAQLPSVQHEERKGKVVLTAAGYRPGYMTQWKANAKANFQANQNTTATPQKTHDQTPEKVSVSQANYQQNTQPSGGSKTQQVVHTVQLTPGQVWGLNLGRPSYDKPLSLKSPQPLTDQTQAQTADRNSAASPTNRTYNDQANITTESQTAQSQVAQPQLTQPQETQQQATLPQTAQPQATEPQAAQPQTDQPQATQPSGASETKQVAQTVQLSPGQVWGLNLGRPTYDKPLSLKSPQPLTDQSQAQTTGRNSAAPPTNRTYNEQDNIAQQKQVSESQTAQSQVAQPQSTQPQESQQQATQPQTAQPQATQQQATQPQAAQPQESQQQATQPQEAQPQATQQQATQPQAAQPQATQQQAAQSQAAQPQESQQQATQTQAAQPQESQQQATQPQEAQPQTTQQQATQPQEAQPQATQQQATQPQEAQPQATQQQAAQPQTAQPQATQQQETQPQETQPQATQKQATQPQESQTQATQQQSAQPQTAQPQATQQQATYTQETQPQANQPQAAQPQTTQQQANNSQETQPQATQQQATQPQAAQSQATQPSNTKQVVNTVQLTPVQVWGFNLDHPTYDKPLPLKSPQPLSDKTAEQNGHVTAQTNGTSTSVTSQKRPQFTPVQTGTGPATGPYVCSHNVDVVFALDSSTDVPDKQWDQQKTFAENVLKSFNVSPAETHAGLVAYSTIPSIEMKLDENHSQNDVLSSLRKMPRDVGNRNLVILLEMAKFEVFTASGGTRTHTPKVLLVTVMGPQKDHNIHAEKSLDSFSRQLKLGGVTVVAVGTDGAQEDDLVHMSSKPEYAVRVKSLLSPEEAEKVSKVICHVGSVNEGPISSQSSVSFNKAQPAPGSSQQKLSDANTPLHKIAAASPHDVMVPQAQPKQNQESMRLTDTHAPLNQAATQLQTPFAIASLTREAYPFKCKPVLFYDFDKLCSGTLFDESGMGNNGKLVGDITTFAGFNGDDGLSFNDGFIQLDGLKFKGKPTDDVTIATWVKLNDINGPNVHELFATSGPSSKGSKTGQYHFEVLDQGKVRFFQRNNGKVVYGLTTKPVVKENEWVHLAGTYESQTNKAVVFVNGEPVVDYLQSDKQETKTLSTDWGRDVQIGKFFDENNSVRQLRGVMDEFYIFPCALASAHIKHLKDEHSNPKYIGPYPGMKREVWRSVPGPSISDLATHHNYPNSPSAIEIISDFDTPTKEGEDYGARVSGYFVPPYTGNYSFSLTAGDHAELFFSPSVLEEKKDLIAEVKNPLGYNAWNTLPYQRTINFYLNAGKYYWLEALHKQDKAKESLAVGYSLECPSSPPVLKERPIPMPSLQYKIPESCAEIKKRWSGFLDDEYMIKMGPSCQPVRLFCYGMHTARPLEYLTLEAGPERNFAVFFRERLLNYESCSGKTNPHPELTAKYWGKTRFSKIRVEPKTGLILRDDFRFASSEGNPVRFGRAGDCYSAASRCHKGSFQIDLSGTGLRLKEDAQWEPWGTPKIPQRLLNYKKSDDGSFAYGECGGSCGGCAPKGERLFLEPVSCEPTKAAPVVTRSDIPKKATMNRHNLSSSKKIVTSKPASNTKIKISPAASKHPVKDLSVKLFSFKGPHIKKFFASEPGTPSESEMEIIGKINKKKRSLHRIRRRSIEDDNAPELIRVKRRNDEERRR